MDCVFCLCPIFRLWYTEQGVTVCECGHRYEEHLRGVGSCLGDAEILPAVKTDES